MIRIIKKMLPAKWSLLSFLVLFILIAIPLRARELKELEVRNAVQTWVRYVTADAKPDAVIERMEPYEVDGRAIAYIAHIEKGGFCFCSANDMLVPVYFYSPDGTYDPNNKSLLFFLRDIEARTQTAVMWERSKSVEYRKYESTFEERRSNWRELGTGVVPARFSRFSRDSKMAAPDSMSLDLTCTWGQGSPYNDQCPNLTPAVDERTLVGCGATAMAQIMYYWKWPNTGQGSDGIDYIYHWRIGWDNEPLAVNPGIPGGWANRLEWAAGQLRMNNYWDNSFYSKARKIDTTLVYRTALENLWNRMNVDTTDCDANFGVTNYNWSIIEDVHTDPPDAGDIEAAELNYHAGIAIEMSYGVKASSAGFSNFEDALENHFRYDTDAEYLSETDIDKMAEEIEWLRPLNYNGSDTGGAGGHFWVVHGYDKNTDPDRQFLMNMGWSGGSNGWYSADTFITGGYCWVPFSYTIKIAPKDMVKFVGNTSSGDGGPDDPYEDINEAVVESPSGATLIFRAGSYNTFSAPSIIIDKHLTLKGRKVTIDQE